MTRGDATRIPALDGIRGVAIGLVLLWHGYFGRLESLPNHPHLERILALGRLTWSGVDLFFVLSGFLIGGILMDAAASNRYFAPFYIRRAHRILPLYGVVLTFAFVAPHLLGHIGTIWIANRIPFAYFPSFLQNFWMAKHGDYGSNILGVTWSLAIEEQFYLTLPLTIRYVSRARLWWIVGGMIAGAPLLRILLNHWFEGGPFASYVLMPCRLDALGFGVAAALIKRTPRMWELLVQRRKYVYIALGGAFLGVLILLLSGFTAFTNQVFGLEYSLLGVFYCLLLIAVLVNKRFEAFFSLRPLRYMGIIAYGLYLLHPVFLTAARTLAARIHPVPAGWVEVAASTPGIVLAIVAAGISWEYLEKPLIKRGHRYKYADEDQ